MLGRKSKLGFGAFVIVASLFNSGCATRSQMSEADLDNYVIDCAIKEQQIAFLHSQRLTATEQRTRAYQNILSPFQALVAPAAASEIRAQGTGRTNWLINQKLMLISRNCP